MQGKSPTYIYSLSCDSARHWRSKIEHQGSHFLRLKETLLGHGKPGQFHTGISRQAIESLPVRIFYLLAGKIREHPSRADGVHCHTACGSFQGSGLGETKERELGGRVSGTVSFSHTTGDGRNIDYAPAAPLQHGRQKAGHDQHGGVQIDIQQLPPGGKFVPGHALGAINTGIIDDDIELPLPCQSIKLRLQFLQRSQVYTFILCGSTVGTVQLIGR